MSNSDLVLINERIAKEFALSTFKDIPQYITTHRDEFITWSSSQDTDCECINEVIQNE